MIIVKTLTVYFFIVPQQSLSIDSSVINRGMSWKCRPPPEGETTFKLCKKLNACWYGDSCIHAHSELELSEWNRQKKAQQKELGGQVNELETLATQLLRELKKAKVEKRKEATLVSFSWYFLVGLIPGGLYLGAYTCTWWLIPGGLYPGDAYTWGLIPRGGLYLGAYTQGRLIPGGLYPGEAYTWGLIPWGLYMYLVAYTLGPIHVPGGLYLGAYTCTWWLIPRGGLYLGAYTQGRAYTWGLIPRGGLYLGAYTQGRLIPGGLYPGDAYTWGLIPRGGLYLGAYTHLGRSMRFSKIKPIL